MSLYQVEPAVSCGSHCRAAGVPWEGYALRVTPAWVLHSSHPHPLRNGRSRSWRSSLRPPATRSPPRLIAPLRVLPPRFAFARVARPRRARAPASLSSLRAVPVPPLGLVRALFSALRRHSLLPLVLAARPPPARASCSVALAPLLARLLSVASAHGGGACAPSWGKGQGRSKPPPPARLRRAFLASGRGLYVTARGGLPPLAPVAYRNSYTRRECNCPINRTPPLTLQPFRKLYTAFLDLCKTAQVRTGRKNT